MSLPFNANCESHNPCNASNPMGGIAFRGQLMSLEKARKYAKIFENKVLQTRTGKHRIPFTAEGKEETAGQGMAVPIDVACAPLLEPKSSPLSSAAGKSIPDLAEPEHSTVDTGLSAYSPPCTDAGGISSLKSIVITFGFLSNLEAHVETGGQVIVVRWVAGTRKSYLFMKEKIGRFRKFLEERLNKKVSADAGYKKRQYESGE